MGDFENMSGSRFNLLLATTAIVMVLAGPSHLAFAGPTTDVDISDAVPMPESANLAPPTVEDLAPVTAESPTGAMSPMPSFPADITKLPAAPETAAPVVAAPALVAPTVVATPAPMPPAAAPAAEAAPAAAPVAVTPAAVTPSEVTPAETPAPAVEAPPLTMDQKVAEKIHELFGTKADRYFADRKNKAAVEAFYSAHAYAPLWVQDGVESRRAKAAASYLAGVDADGLDPTDYPVPAFGSDDPAVLAEAELKFTASVLAFAHHASNGRIHYSRVSADILYNLVPPEPSEVLGKVLEAKNVGQALDSYNPPHPAYKALKAKLAEARGGGGVGGASRISNGQSLKIGMDDPRVPALRTRFGAAEADSTIYDKSLSDAVKKYQQQHGLPLTGVVTNALLDTLNGPRRDHDADIIIANMERWRWLPRDLGKAYVMVNIPEYMLKVVDAGQTAWTTRVVVGQPGAKATPLLTETMKYITVNPTWNVPQSIINNEYLPAYAQDPTVLARMGLVMDRNRDGTIHIYQPPGAGNALGRIRFNFPNKFSVYQHDTPDKYMFAHDKRAYSHGCMRVQDPDKYAEVLLHISNPREGYTADRIRAMYGTGERDIQMQTPIPVHLTYQTASVDSAGHLVIREDIYGRDARLLAALKGEDRRIADTPLNAERHEASGYGAPRRQAVQTTRPSGGFLFGLFR
jgi:murein L,D-transpeptidase YcbB/YkuD